jgi:2-polyprenyl-6-methoxyphenol hydroxylase-like FAD-dependent oxidoreductase
LLEATLGSPSQSIRQLGDPDLAVVTDSPFQGRPGRPDSVRPGRSASRQLVRRILAYGLQNDVRYGAEFTGYQKNSDGTVTVSFADGKAVTGDVLVGADGIGSGVRHQLLPHAEVRDTGVRWLGGKTPLTAEIMATGLPERIGGSFSMISVDGLVMIVAAMRFAEQPAAAADRLLPGFSAGDVADYLMWAVIPPRKVLGDLDARFPQASSADLLVFAKEATKGAHPALRLLIEQAFGDQTYGLAMGCSEPVDPWPAGNVTLLGDAVHAMLPNRGSGANTALQDARRLRDTLVGINRGEAELVSAIAAYEEKMRRDGYEAVRASVADLSEFAPR